MLGGKTIEEEPLAIFLKSGDIVVMSEESRLCYHGVPKILKANERSWANMSNFKDHNLVKYDHTFKFCIDENLWKPFSDYLDKCRINMNVRQVLCKSQKNLDDKL